MTSTIPPAVEAARGASSRVMAGGLAITRRARVRGFVLSAGEASLEEEELAVLLVLAKGLISSTGREMALHLLTGGAFSGAAVSAAFPTVAILNAPDETPFLDPAAAEEESLASPLSSSSAAAPNADLRAMADADGLAALPAAALGLLRAVGAKRRAADQVAAGHGRIGGSGSPVLAREGQVWDSRFGLSLLASGTCGCAAAAVAVAAGGADELDTGASAVEGAAAGGLACPLKLIPPYSDIL